MLRANELFVYLFFSLHQKYIKIYISNYILLLIKIKIKSTYASGVTFRDNSNTR